MINKTDLKIVTITFISDEAIENYVNSMNFDYAEEQESFLQEILEGEYILEINLDFENETADLWRNKNGSSELIDDHLLGYTNEEEIKEFLKTILRDNEKEIEKGDVQIEWAQ